MNAKPESFYAPDRRHFVDFMPRADMYGDLRDDRTYFQMLVNVIGLDDRQHGEVARHLFDPVDIFEAIKDEPRHRSRL